MTTQDLKIGDRIESPRLYFNVGTVIALKDGGFLVKSDDRLPVVLFVSEKDSFNKI